MYEGESDSLRRLKVQAMRQNRGILSDDREEETKCKAKSRPVAEKVALPIVVGVADS